jgi:hypothetical protein
MPVGHRIVTRSLALRVLRVFLALLAPPLASASVAGCGHDAPPAKHPLRPLSEQRASNIISGVFRDAGLKPEADRYLKVAHHEQRLRLEVAAAGRRFGVAYLTEDDVRLFGDVLPPHPTDDALAVGSVDGHRVLVLFAGDYTEDDLAGDEHSATTIAADRRVARDVRDFVQRAQEQKWP